MTRHEPHAWRAERSSERTTFSFRHASLAAAIFFALSALLASVVAFGSTALVFSVEHVGALWLAPIDLGAIAIIIAAATRFNRTRIVIEGGFVDWTYGPFFGDHVRMTFAEAVTLGAVVVPARSGTIARLGYEGATGNEATLSERFSRVEQARFVVDEVASEITTRVPELEAPRAGRGLVRTIRAQPPAWRETRTRALTTFRFRDVPWWRATVLTIVTAPIPIIAFSMTSASIREGNWGLGYACVGGFDLVALGILFFIVMQHSRTHIAIDGAHVVWTSGPFLRTRIRMTFEEAATINGVTTIVKRSAFIRFSCMKGTEEVRLGSTLDDASQAQWVLEHVDAELQKREPGIKTRIALAGFGGSPDERREP